MTKEQRRRAVAAILKLLRERFIRYASKLNLMSETELKETWEKLR